MSHDWPASIEQHGNIDDLLRRKPFLRSDIENRALGSPPLFDLLRALKPDWWFSAHLHVKYDAKIFHEELQQAPPTSSQVKNPDEIVIDNEEDEKFDDSHEEPAQTLPHPPRNPDEITLDDEEANVAPVPVPRPPQIETRFMALDKCIPKSRRQFLEVEHMMALLYKSC
jgi:lariat debranching enzyme